MIISITGVAGSGKSTVAKMIAKELKLNYYSIGELQRKLAKEKGISLEELRRLEETDSSFDKEFDEYQKNLGLNEDNFVMESRLSAFFVPTAFKVFLDCDGDIRYKRIVNDGNHNRSVELKNGTKDTLLKRDSDDATRLEKLFGFNYMQKDNYDLIVDTSKISAKEVADLILRKYSEFISAKKL